MLVLEDGARTVDGAAERLGRPGQALGVSRHSRAAPRGGPAGAGDVTPISLELNVGGLSERSPGCRGVPTPGGGDSWPSARPRGDKGYIPTGCGVPLSGARSV